MRGTASVSLLLLCLCASPWHPLTATSGEAAEVGQVEELDPKVEFCTRVVDEFNYGIKEVEHHDEKTGEYLGLVLTKTDIANDPSVQLQWGRYRECVNYLTNDPWTREEYLRYATSAHAPLETCEADADAQACRRKGAAKSFPRSLVLGAQHPVVLTPGKPNLSRFFLIPAYDFVVGSFVKHAGTYDPNEEDILRSLLFEGDCAIEVGSNIGSYTVVLADQVGKKGLVYAYEPFRKIYQIMNANVALQGYGNVVTKQVGVSNKRQFISVQAPALNDFTNLGAARVFFQQKEEVAHVPFDGLEEIEVETLDGMRINCGQGDGAEDKRVDFIKIDAEGLELEVVEGGLALINAHQPLIYAETQPYFQEGDDTFFRKMREYGYICSPIPNLEMHELVLCVPLSRYDELKKKIPFLRR